MTDVVETEGRTVQLAVVVLGLILALLVVDLISDAGERVGMAHLVVEGVALMLSVFGVGALVLRLRRVDLEQRGLEHRLAASQDEAAHWRREAAEAVAGLGVALQRQFDRWQLTEAERQVALLLLQGLSHKQIAGRRGASERTVRQQAHMLYRKAGVAGRADLAAFFLQDLRPAQPSSP
ncbi:MAG: LuxR C-terminal-related transcriptional regulator [Thermoanaerobaculia bacterium]